MSVHLKRFFVELNVTQDDIVSYYDNCQVDYEIVWHLNSRMSMHYGYWDKTTPNLRTALTNMNVQVAEMAAIPQGAHVLDAGCGVGGSSVFLSKNFGCTTMGITLSDKQVEKCKSNAAAHGVGDKCSFEKRSYLDTGFPDNSFDVVWAIESVCHANEKADFLKEAFRVLRKGGVLILADFFSLDEAISKDSTSYLQKWAATWAVPGFEFHKAFEEKAKGVGFATVEARNITENIYPSAKRLYYCFIPGIICDGTLRILGKRSPDNKANVWSTYYQYKSLKKDEWNYYIFKAVKS